MDFYFTTSAITIHNGKAAKDRATFLPQRLANKMLQHSFAIPAMQRLKSAAIAAQPRGVTYP
jgi:hypothetical protein